MGDIPWGTHFCHFYGNKRDLLDVLIPYFKTGLAQNELCVWEVFDPLNEQEAREALEHASPDAGAHFAAGDIEIVSPPQVYRGDGACDPEQLVHDWEAKLDTAQARGCTGMRVNTNPAWFVESDRRSLDAYEEALGGLIANRRMILLCAYPLAVHRAAEILHARLTHQFAVARRRGEWQVVETAESGRARAKVKRLTAELESCAAGRARELAVVNRNRRQEAAARHRAEHALRVCGDRSLCYFELGLVGMAIVSPAKEFIEINSRLCGILGYSRRELMEMAWAALVHPDDLADDTRNHDRILAGEVDGYLIPRRWIRKNGDVVHTNMSVKCQRREDGLVEYFAMMLEEVIATYLEGHDGLPDHKDLSGRELQTLGLMGLGRTVKEIAGALSLSEKTVSTYRSRILRKLNLTTTSELIRYALQNRLAD